MTVLVKYCGGCNAGYDRAAFVGRLRSDFPAATFIYAGIFDPVTGTATGPTEADVVLVVCGCLVRCADHAHLIPRQAKFIVSSPEDYPRIQQELRSLMLKEEKPQ
jgi:4-hydroxybutyrate CoA-transferase